RIADGSFVPFVRLDPARRALSLAQRLVHVRVEALPLDRPRAYKRLPEQIVLVRVFEHAPPAHELRPLLISLGEDADPRPYLSGPLRVVRLRRQRVTREWLGPLEAPAW